MNHHRELILVLSTAKTAFRVIGASPAATDAAVILVAGAAAGAVVLVGFGLYQLLRSDD